MARKPYPGERPQGWQKAAKPIPGQRPPDWVSPVGSPKKQGIPLAVQVILMISGLFVFIVIAAPFLPKPSKTEQSGAAASVSDTSLKSGSDPALQAQIAPDAISSYSASDRKTYPKLFAKLGKRMDEVGPLGKKAALLALQTKQCDRVVYVDVSERSSPTDLQFFVDCADETRVRVTEADIKSGLAQDIETKSDRMAKASANIAEYDALVVKAKDRVRASSRDPGSAEFGTVAISHKDGTVACGTVNSKNGFGGMSGQQPFIAFRDGIIMAESEPNFRSQWERYCG